MVNYDTRGLEVSLVINRMRAARAGATAADLDNILYDWFGQSQARPRSVSRSIHARVVMEVEPRFREDPSDVDSVLS